MDHTGPEVGTVIIVDEDASVRASLRRLFRAAGHAVRAYSHVARLSHSQRPDGPCCLVMDLRWAGEAGPSFKDRAGVRVPTIFISGADDDVADAANVTTA